MEDLIGFVCQVSNFILAFVPLFICSALCKFAKEMRRHNQAVEVRLDFIAKELKRLTGQE